LGKRDRFILLLGVGAWNRLDELQAMAFACWCARQVWHLLDKERFRRAVEMAERFVNCQVAEEQMNTMRRWLAYESRDAYTRYQIGNKAPYTTGFCAAQMEAEEVVRAAFKGDAQTAALKSAAALGNTARYAAASKEISELYSAAISERDTTWIASFRSAVRRGSEAYQAAEKAALESQELKLKEMLGDPLVLLRSSPV